MLTVYFILGSFCYIFRESYKCYIIIYTPILVLRLGMIFFPMFCRFLDLFALTLAPNWVWFNSSWMLPIHYARGRKEELGNFETEATIDAPWWRLRSVVSLKLLVSSCSFNLWLRMPEFMLKKGFSAADEREPGHLSSIFMSFLSLVLGFFF